MLRLKGFLLWSALVLCGAADAQIQAPNRLILHVDDLTTYVDFRNWSNHAYIRMEDASNHLGWYPFYDGYHNTIDVAACLRLEVGTPRVFRIDNQAVIGKRSYRAAQPLNPLNVPVRSAGGYVWLPIDEIAKTMDYQVQYDVSRQTLTLDAPRNPIPTDLPDSCQHFIKKGGFYRN